MEQKKSYIGIKNSVDDSTLELYFTDFIFDGFDWETWELTNMVQETIDKIKEANPTTIKLTINSLGGDVMIGLAIYNFLKNYKASVEVEVIGFAASIASVIAMSASEGKLKMAKNSFMILHAASSYAGGNAKDMRDQADVLDKVSAEMAEIYADRSGQTAKYFTDSWADGGDVWYTGKEAKKIGLADELTNDVVMTASVDLAAYGYKNIPNKITQLLNQNKPTMAFTKTITASKADAFTVTEGGFLLTEDQLNNIEAQLAGGEGIVTALAVSKTETETANAALVTAQAEITALQTKETEATAAATTAATAAATKIAELEAKVAELGKAPSGSGTTLKVEKDASAETEEVPAYLDDNSGINAWADKQMKYYPKQEKVPA